MGFLDEQQNIDRIQEISLALTTSGNPYLTPSVLPFLNKALNTNSKQVIQAINELHKRLNINDMSLQTFMNDLLQIIGDWKANPALESDLHVIAPSMLEAIIFLYNSLKKHKKTMSFQFYDTPRDIEKLTIRFPYTGIIDNVFASCNTVGTVNTEILIEKMSIADFDSGVGTWTNILSSNVFIDAGKQTNLTSVTPYVISDYNTNMNDIFRIRLNGVSDIKELSVQIDVGLM